MQEVNSSPSYFSKSIPVPADFYLGGHFVSSLVSALCSSALQVFKEEEEAIKVDLHEGCGRTKLFWLMALADSKTMKAMVEFREHTGNLA